ncbi:MAG: ABC transporter permease [Chloroflexi bacterium]|nr:ABC transporter permease [Chloroflexota bacterium]MBV9547165.1 ABC transporter permease [Chloroflexota bacterium]
MRPAYVLRRFGVFLLVIWAAATVNFIIPRLSPVDPIKEALLKVTSMGASQAGMETLTRTFAERFGLNQPVWRQYLNYLVDSAQFNFGFSISYFPTRVIDMIGGALPWTIVLVGLATALTFAAGTILGAFMAWPYAPRAIRIFAPPLLTLSSIPYYLLGLILIYLFAFVIHAFPLGGGYSVGLTPSWNLAFLGDATRHAILPALSIMLAELGFWALAMRGMMITIQGEDYMTLAEAKGLQSQRVFYKYGVRNAMLPQMTALALSMGRVVSGALLVEVVFAYPGVGNLLYQAIRTFDYFVIYGVVFIVIVAIGLATFFLDLTLPVLDPRINY